METSVRIEVPEDLYSMILKEQESRKKRDGRKTAIAEIILEYFRLGMEKTGSNYGEVSEFAEIVSESGGDDHNRILLNDLLKFEKQLKKREESLHKTEHELVQARIEINIGYSDLHEKQMQTLEFKERALDTVEKTLGTQSKFNQLQAEVNNLKSVIVDKEQQIDMLKKETKDYREKILKSLNLIGKRGQIDHPSAI